MLPFLPGSLPHDGAGQIKQYFGWVAGGSVNNHQPWVLTMVMGSIVRIGSLINDHFAIGFAIFVFSFVECLIYSYVCLIIYRKFNSAKLYKSFIIFYALVPCFGSYAQAIIKDGLYAAIMSLYVVIYLNVFSCLVNKTISGFLLSQSVIKLILVALTVAFLRNEGIYIVVVSSIVLLIVADGRKKIPVLLMIAVICLNVISWNSVSKKLGIVTPFTKEMLSIPLQQTARYLRDYPNDVSAKEEKALSGFLDYKNLAKVYNPQLSDPVKGYNVLIDKQRFSEYLKAWWSMFLKHPDTYIQATLNNTFGYFYPFCKLRQTNVFYISYDTFPPNFKYDYVFSSSMRDMVVNWNSLWTSIPLFGLMTCAGTYGWFLLFFIGYMAKFRKNKDMLALNIPVLLFLVCLASPANGFIRYAFPLASTFPVYFCWVLGKETETGHYCRENG